jgi:hypothetical protein
MNKAIVATEIDESLEAGIGKTLHALKPPGVAFRHLASCPIRSLVSHHANSS